MLRTLKRLQKVSVHATDGSIGSVDDIYFDDLTWAIRYLVIDTGDWLPGRKVLIAPPAILPASAGESQLRLKLTAEQIRNSPDINTDQPISRQQEAALYQYYDWPVYWPTYPTGVLPAVPSLPVRPPPPQTADQTPEGDPNLRSMREVRGYAIDATDGEIGHVEDFVIDDTEHTVRLIVVDTRNWLPGRKVAIPPSWVDAIDWATRQVTLSSNREMVKNSPELDQLEELA